ncbi:MAG: hypothetical protein ILP19_00625 [Oscillospiraceae bacterium]|nr:hypothetical protein [Oscillospiraceae bacterium]
MFADVKKKIRTKAVIMAVLMLIMAAMSLFFGIMRTGATGVGRKGMIFTLVMVSVFLIIGLVNTLSFALGYKKMMSCLGDPTDDEMDVMLSEAEPVDTRDVPLIYVAGERILNFDTLRAYDMHNIRRIAKNWYTRTDNDNGTSSSSYTVDIKLDGSQRKDTMSFSWSSDCDHAYQVVTEACRRLGVNYTD